MAKRCPGCMKLKTNSPVCEHCGYNENVPNYSHQLPVGTLLQGRYQVGKVLGQGGFGITYMGWDQALMTPVAIKEYYPNSFVSRECSLTLNVSCAGDEAAVLFAHNRERFLREAQILAKLSNVPGIVRINNLFSENNTAYITMEYVEGIDLKRYIRMQNRVLTVEEAFSILRPVMYALSKVHEAELVHRDISPDNIMILPDGMAKLLDFGAAREVEHADVYSDLPQSTEAILKHGFAPMEQYRRRGSLGPWTDVYALCATLYYCLTGRLPNSAPERIMGDDNVNWRQIPGLSQQQVEILEKGMALLPENRISSMKELWNGLFGQGGSTFTGLPKEEPKPVSVAAPEKKPENYPTHTIPLEEPNAPAEPKPAPAPVVMETKQKKKKAPVFVIAAMLAVIAAVGLGLFSKKAKDQPETILVPETFKPEFFETQPSETLPDKDVLHPAYPLPSPDSSPHTFEMMKVELLYTNSKSEEPFWGQTAYPRSAITHITFHDSMNNVPSNAWDVSVNQDRTILAWVEDSHYLHVSANGNIAPNKDASYLFFYFNNLVSIDFGNCFDTSSVTNIRDMFHGCSRLTFLDLSNFDTSNVTNISNMFNGCSRLTFLDLSNFDTSNVTNMDYMFAGCSELTTLDLSNFDTSNVTFMSGMFKDCSGLTSLDLSNFDTSNVTSMFSMFAGCSGLTSLDLSNFITSNVTDMAWMFYKCVSLTSLDLSNFITSNVTDMGWMFSNCIGLTSLDLSNFDTSNLTDIDKMFNLCVRLKNIKTSDNAIRNEYRSGTGRNP